MDSLAGFAQPEGMPNGHTLASMQRAIPYVAAGVALGCLAAVPFFWMGREKNPAREAKDMREHLSESQIDKTLKDTFPASDPPGWY